MSISMKAGLAAALAATTLFASAQMMPGHRNMPSHGEAAAPAEQQMHSHEGMGGAMPEDMMQTHQQMMQDQGGMGSHGMMDQQSAASAQPTLPGQDAFGQSRRSCGCWRPIRPQIGPKSTSRPFVSISST